MDGEPPAQEAPGLDWGRHEAEILDLLLTRNYKLREVRKHMEDKYKFFATERQYKYRFPRLKYISEEEYADIAGEIRLRATLGKQTAVYLHGHPVPQERVRRGIDRIQKPGSKPPGPKRKKPQAEGGRISLRTPSPGPLVCDRSTPQAGNPQTAVQTHHVSSAEPTMDMGLLPWTPSQMRDWESVVGALGRLETDLEAGVQGLGGASLYLSGGFSSFNRFGSHPRLELLEELPFFRLLRGVEKKSADYHFLPGHPSLGGRRDRAPTPTVRHASLLAMAQSIFGGPLNSVTEQLSSTASVHDMAAQLRYLIPERFDGELVRKLEPVLDGSLPVRATLPWFFSTAAFLASNNHLTDDQADAFLKWVIDEGRADALALFMDMSSPTVHAFARVLLASAVRIKNVLVLETLLNCGVKLDSWLFQIASVVKDAGFTERLLSEVNPVSLVGSVGANTFLYCLDQRHFHLARLLLEKGVSPNVQSDSQLGTALHRALGKRDGEGVKFLLDMGADVNLCCLYEVPLNGRLLITPLGYAAVIENVELFTRLLDHGGDTTTRIDGTPLIEWAALKSRPIFDVLKRRMGPEPTRFLLGDLVDSANHGRSALDHYVARYQQHITAYQLERALEESVQCSYMLAVVTLLNHGVNPSCPELGTPPLVSILWQGEDRAWDTQMSIGLLVAHGADLSPPELLYNIAFEEENGLLDVVLESGVELRHRRKALLKAVKGNNCDGAAKLIRTGLDVNTPGLRKTLLQAACCQMHGGRMMQLLLSHGANANAPAHPDGGRTPLQAALEGKSPIKAAKILLSYGVDASAHPAKRRGLTALEALCHNRCREIREGSGGQQLCHELLDAGAMVNRPRRRPSSALHGVIEKGWHDILARFLELGAITTHIWCRADNDNSDNASDDDIDDGNDVKMDDSEDDYSDYDSDDNDDNRKYDISDLNPFFPTQLAASRGDLKALTMLLKRGTDANAPPASDSGRTALQAACLLKPGPEKTAVIDLLLHHGADIHAAPAARRGVTALQAAAISGDFVLAEYFLSCGADVNEAPSGYEGRTAIEGAAEHGRLDMVQLLLNAGAKGDPDRWVRLAGANGHVAVCSLLKEQRQEDS